MQRDNLQQVSVLQDACARLHEQARDAAHVLSLSHRYECLPGCLERPGKVIGTGFYDMVNNRVVVKCNTYYNNLTVLSDFQQSTHGNQTHDHDSLRQRGHVTAGVNLSVCLSD